MEVSICFRWYLLVFPPLLFFVGVNFATAATAVSTNITSDTTWNAAGSPYILTEHISIASGVTLTIDPGVVVKMTDTRLITVNGNLAVNGTEVDPVYFTSSHDDSVGGDSNNNASATTPKARDWRAINFKSGSTGEFSHTIIRYAGYNRAGSKPIKAMPAIYNEGGTVLFNAGEIADSNFAGIGQTSGSVAVDGANIAGNDFGVVVVGGDLSLINSGLSNHLNMAVYATGDGVLTLQDNNFVNNHTAVDVSLISERNFIHSGNTASGGTFNGIVLRGPISSETTLKSGDLPYLISGIGTLNTTGIITITTDGDLTVASTGTLNLEAGTIMKFANGTSIQTDGTLNSNGTDDEPVYFTSIKDDEAGGDTNGDGNASAPAPSDWKQLKFGSGSTGNFEHAVIRYGGARVGSDVTQTGILNTGGTLNIENSEIANNNFYGVRQTGGTTVIHNSSIHGHVNAGVHNQTSNVIDATNNFWGDPSGPHHSTNPSGLGDNVSDNVLFEPWLGEWPPAGTTCCSSILFLPGIMSSRLYLNGEKLWEGEDSEVDQLYLNSDGTSQNGAIYTKDVIGTFDAVIDQDLYQTFFDKLDELVVDGTINEHKAIPYDWRLSIDDVLSNGYEDENGNINYNQATSNPYIEQTLRRLAAESKSGKVTIVSHSNGGLVAKALVNQLGNETSALVDKIIFVGVPQLGTPQAIASLLNGYDAGVPFDVSDEKARDFSINSPMIYQLLPHPDYYDNDGVSISTPYVSFEPGSATNFLIDAYGTEINNNTELVNFLNGAEGRDKSDFSDLVNPTIANPDLLSDAQGLMNEIGSSWQAPDGIVVHQIAGIGEQTVAGVTYKTIKDCVFNIGAKCVGEKGEKLSYTPFEVVDGDGTVVEPSALLMSTSTDGVKRWWVDLYDYNKIIFSIQKPVLRTGHGTILSIPELGEFIVENLLTNRTESLPDYLSDSRPELPDTLSRMTFVLHSPLSLSLTDVDGNTIDERKPDSEHASFTRYGEVQVVNVFTDHPFTVNLYGQAPGSFTLEMFEFSSGELLATTTFSAIPSATNTEAVMEFVNPTIAGGGDLQIDYDGDGTTDLLLEPKEGEVINAPAPTVDDLISYFKLYVNENIDDTKVRNQFIKDIEHFQKMYEKSKTNRFLNPVIFLINLKVKINVYARISKINDSVADDLLSILYLIEAKL